MRHATRIAAFAVAASSLLTLSACGSEQIDVAKNDPYYKGAEIFAQRCSGCHTLSVTGTQGSASSSFDKEPSDGPNFDQRPETKANILYALRNGGFSGKIMPANIVVGEEAEAVAEFLAEYAGRDAANPAAPKRVAEEDSTTPGSPAGGKSLSGGSPEPGTPEGGPETQSGTPGADEPAQGQRSTSESP